MQLKRVFAILLALALVLALAACDPQKDADAFLAEYKIAIDEYAAAYEAFLENPEDEELRQAFEEVSEKVNLLEGEAKEISESFGDDEEGLRQFRSAYLELMEQAITE